MMPQTIIPTIIGSLFLTLGSTAKVLRVDSGADGAADGETWADAFVDLQNALEAAQSGDEIWIAEGIYKPSSEANPESTFRLKSGLAIYGGFTGSESIRAERNPDPATNSTVLSGDSLGNDSEDLASRADNSLSVVSAFDLNQPATLGGLTIMSGGSLASSTGSGGGINTRDSSVILKGIRIIDNHGRGGGGCSLYDSTITLENCTFESNESGERGGGIHSFRSQISITTCRFEGNASESGGGAYLQESNVLATDLSFLKNHGRNGGAIYADGSQIALWNSMLAENGNEDDPGSFVGRGGGINSRQCDFQITNCAFVGNLVKYLGGAIYAVSDSAAGSLEKNVKVINSTFYGNGVIEAGPFPLPSTVFHCVASSNIILQNSIVAPAPGQREQFVFSDQPPFPGHPLHPESCCNLIEGGLTGYEEIIDASPLFIDSIGPDGIPATADDDLRLQSNSPAVGNARTELLPNDSADLDADSNTDEPTPFDLAGQTRLAGLGLELGAFETQGLFFTANNIEQAQPGEGEVTISGWLSGYSADDGLTVVFTRINSANALPFLVEPTLSDTGALIFTPAPNASGIAIYEISISDSSGNLPAPPTQGFSISIGQRVWRVDASAEGHGDGTTWEDAFARFEDALAIAKAGDQIWVAQGRYTPEFASGQSFQIPSSVTVYGGFQGTEETLAQRATDPGSHPTLLDGDLMGNDNGFENRSDNSAHVIVLNEANSSTIVDGFTVRGGEAADPNGESQGGAILSSGNPIFSNLTIIENRAVYGGGIFSLEGAPQISNCLFQKNTALEDGGALGLESGFSNVDTELALVEECQFYQNSAESFGGAIKTQRDLLLIKSCRFEENSAGSGGAIRFSHTSIDLIECDFIKNSAGSGAAISAYNYSGRIQLNRFFGNSADRDGGAGFFLSDSNPQFTNCLFSGNSAGDEGGAIKVDRSNLKLTHCTLANNSALWGGGLSLDAEENHTLQNSIIWGNHSFGLPSEVVWFHDDFFYSSDIPDSFTTLTPDSGGLLVRGGLRNRDDVMLAPPLFLNPTGLDGIAGTKDDDLRTGPSSPAHGAGLPGILPADLYDFDGDGDTAEPIPVDLAGEDRLIGAKLDLGAFESATPSFFFPDVRLPEVPDGLTLIQTWTFIDSNIPPTFFTEITQASGNLSFEIPIMISPQGNLEFQVTPDTSGWAEIEVFEDLNGVNQSLGSFTIFVSPVIYFVDANHEPSGNGQSWEQPFPTLSEALGFANEGDEIRVAQGTYYAAGAPEQTATFNLKQGVRIRGGFTGDETGSTPNDPSARSTLSGRFPIGEGLERRAALVVTAEGVDETTLLESLIISGGGGSLSGQANRGSGLYCRFASPTLRRVAIIDNFAAGNGGGLYLSSSSSIIDRCFIGGNIAGGSGGGIYLGSSTEPTIINTIVTGNRAFDRGGGIQAATFDSDFSLINSTITNNTSNFGTGGVNTRSLRPKIQSSIIYGNSRTNGAPSELTTNTLDEENLSNNIIRGGYDNFGNEHVIDMDPLFVNPSGPDLICGTLDDDLRLLQSSPAIDAGNGTLLPEGVGTDFLNQPRIAGIEVDLGAIEGSIPATFALLYPGLDPNGDENHNSVSNFAEYATGHDPRSSPPSNLGLHVSRDSLTYQIRENASDLSFRLQKSTDLKTWMNLAEGVDFIKSEPARSGGGVEYQVLELSDPLSTNLFFRQVLESNQ
jgi:parallel beta-helix repeat protein/predicted outer membrane repeat protein